MTNLVVGCMNLALYWWGRNDDNKFMRTMASINGVLGVANLLMAGHTACRLKGWI